jgi:hypothetical protein
MIYYNKYRDQVFFKTNVRINLYFIVYERTLMISFARLTSADSSSSAVSSSFSSSTAATAGAAVASANNFSASKSSSL